MTIPIGQKGKYSLWVFNFFKVIVSKYNFCIEFKCDLTLLSECACHQLIMICVRQCPSLQIILHSYWCWYSKEIIYISEKALTCNWIILHLSSYKWYKISVWICVCRQVSKLDSVSFVLLMWNLPFRSHTVESSSVFTGCLIRFSFCRFSFMFAMLVCACFFLISILESLQLLMTVASQYFIMVLNLISQLMIKYWTLTVSLLNLSCTTTL